MSSKHQKFDRILILADMHYFSYDIQIFYLN